MLLRHSRLELGRIVAPLATHLYRTQNPFALFTRRLNTSTMTSPLRLNPLDPKIQLTPEESRIRSLLVEFCNVFNAANPDRDPVVLRITGGWVRDKLLGLASQDIDIGINNLTGLEFAENLKQYMTKYADRLGVQVKGIHKVEKNPDKSKHLETATTNLFGLDIDFVNLRCEEYAGDSRIPNVEFGTPVQDAFRRDATLNALFYNLQEQKIEDFTERGLQDLKNGILRTPLEPLETFNEDPLRVLRLIRFSAKYGFPVADDTLLAMGHPEIKQALIRKISRERVGVEVSKMLATTTKYPEKGLFTIASLELEDAIFHINPQSLIGQLPPSGLTELTRAAHDLEVNKISLHSELQKEFLPTTKHRYIFWLSVPMTRFDGLKAVNDKRKQVPATEKVIRDGLKLPLHEGNTVLSLFSHKQQVWEAASSGESSRRKLGVLIRQCGDKWRLTVLYSLLWRLNMRTEPEAELISAYNSLVSKIMELGLDEAYAVKPLINGKEIMDLYKVKGGSWTARAVDAVIEMRLEDPDISKEKCEEQLLKMKNTFLT